MDSTTISTEIKKLSIAERILLVEELWNSILRDQDKLKLTSSQRDELDSRLQEYQHFHLSAAYSTSQETCPEFLRTWEKFLAL